MHRFNVSLHWRPSKTRITKRIYIFKLRHHSTFLASILSIRIRLLDTSLFDFSERVHGTNLDLIRLRNLLFQRQQIKNLILYKPKLIFGFLDRSFYMLREKLL
jgi:hypothetical protein